MTRRRLVRPSHGARGFTLLEVMVTLPLVSLLMLGAFNLFLMSLQLGGKTSAQLAVTQDAANAIQQVVEVGREAGAVTLLGNAGNGGAAPPAGSGFSDAQFHATLGTETILTGIWVTMPAPLAPSDVNYTNPSLKYITVMGNQSNGIPSAAQGAPMPSAPYNFSTPTPAELAGRTQFLIYRADGDGTPDPSAGRYLWEQPLPVSSGTPGSPLCRTIAAGTPNAVQFDQPTGVANQIEVKIVSGVYSAINGVQTDEEGNGTFTSQLDGKCTLMRDYSAGGISNGTTGTYSPFSAH